jgi:stage II sporulation protein D
MKSYSGFLYLFLFVLIAISGCSSSPKFTSRNDELPGRYSSASEGDAIRVLMDNPSNSFTWTVESKINLAIDSRNFGIINRGIEIELVPNGDDVNLRIAGRIISGKVIVLSPEEGLISFKGHSYRGTIKVFAENGSISIVNSLPLEDYLKGVLPLEMPIGNNNENYEALMAFAICARTYSLNKLYENKSTFDVYIDTRDQVYGGAENEKDITNKAVDETRDLILTYNGKPAITYYSAACGGHTENVKNVFAASGPDLPYLAGVKDGDGPNCAIAPKFEWEERYTQSVFVDRLKTAGLIDNVNFMVGGIEVASRFESGRVNELRITLSSNVGDDKVVSVYGNNIRSVIRTANNKGILRSNLFDISMEAGDIIIKGRGYGHGVGLCQWGSIYLSRIGWNYQAILNHYFPGTQIGKIHR